MSGSLLCDEHTHVCHVRVLCYPLLLRRPFHLYLPFIIPHHISSLSPPSGRRRGRGAPRGRHRAASRRGGGRGGNDERRRDRESAVPAGRVRGGERAPDGAGADAERAGTEKWILVIFTLKKRSKMFVLCFHIYERYNHSPHAPRNSPDHLRVFTTM